MSTALYAVIMAGGSGKRFWPHSRRRRPKQFLPLGCGIRSLLRAAFDRVLPLTDRSRMLVVAGESFRESVFEVIPELQVENFVGEPEGRGTAPCIGLAAHIVQSREPNAALLACPADHVIAPEEEFHRSVRVAMDLIETHAGEGPPLTVMMGVPPDFAATGFGYIEAGDVIRSDSGQDAHRVLSFREKPDRAAAESLIATGRFLWNSGVFLWRAKGVLDLIARYLPQLAAGLTQLVSPGSSEESLSARVSQRFASLPEVSIDRGVVEKAAEQRAPIIVVKASFGWDDVGTWEAAAKYLGRDASGNRVQGRHVGLETRNCILVGGKRLIATLGIEDLVVVESDDAILVCRREVVERVRELVEELERRGETEVL